ncbi:MAG: biotin transporter BioY [Clostridia bacterium]|nr:biotin transporter BioY [Clostridia bacterium]
MKNRFSVKDLCFIALSAALLAVCSWISIPAAVPFTLQTFAVFAVLMMLGAWRGLAAIALYLMIGAVGLPVFSGFKGGIAALFGPTGGYLFGFLLTALTYRLIGRREKLWTEIVALAVGLILCYAFGTVWFVKNYTGGAEMTFLHALEICVFPFLLPDALKLAVAAIVSIRVRKAVRL